MENKFPYKKVRGECFSQYFPYDEELKTIVDIKQKAISKKVEENHDFLKKPITQNMHLYLVEYVLAFSKKWFGSDVFTILDWGCGKCQVSYLLKKRNAQVVSCDREITEHADSFFGQYTPIADFAKIDVVPLKHDYLLPFDNETFEVVLSFGVLEHVPNDKQSLIEINRILKPNGLFFCFWLPHKYSWRQSLERYKGNYYHDRLYKIKQIKQLLSETKYDLLDDWYRDLLPKKSCCTSYRKTENSDNWLCRNTFLKYFAANIEFVARKFLN